MVTVSVSDCWLPTFTLPNAALAGLFVSCPGVMPLPVSGIVSVGFEAFEVRVTFPLAAPLDGGAKTTLKLVL